jgi:predicted mannosyl-3-phosphoglycerate phosphatase (HAD superfamily)
VLDVFLKLILKKGAKIIVDTPITRAEHEEFKKRLDVEKAAAIV